MSAPVNALPPEHAWALITAALVGVRTLRLHCTDAREAERRGWLQAIADSLHIAVEALPDSPTEEDIQRLPAIPASQHDQVLKLLVLASLHVSAHLPARASSRASAAKDVATVDTAYSALSRTLVYRTAALLRIPAQAVLPAEQAVAADLYALLQQQSGSSLSSAGKSAVADAKSSSTAWKWAATGAGAILGGVAIGLTGGLAAPLIVGASGGLVGRLFRASADCSARHLRGERRRDRAGIVAGRGGLGARRVSRQSTGAGHRLVRIRRAQAGRQARHAQSDGRHLLLGLPAQARRCDRAVPRGFGELARSTQRVRRARGSGRLSRRWPGA